MVSSFSSMWMAAEDSEAGEDDVYGKHFIYCSNNKCLTGAMLVTTINRMKIEYDPNKNRWNIEGGIRVISFRKANPREARKYEQATIDR